MRVLVIDNNKFSQTVFESELHQQNVMVDLATDGAVGLELLRKNKPDLVVMELILPKINGFDLLDAVKKDKNLKHIPILVYTELAQKNDKDEALDKGITKFFSKDDFSPKQIIQEILNILMNTTPSA